MNIYFEDGTLKVLRSGPYNLVMFPMLMYSFIVSLFWMSIWIWISAPPLTNCVTLNKLHLFLKEQYLHLLKTKVIEPICKSSDWLLINFQQTGLLLVVAAEIGYISKHNSNRGSTDAKSGRKIMLVFISITLALYCVWIFGQAFIFFHIRIKAMLARFKE